MIGRSRSFGRLMALSVSVLCTMGPFWTVAAELEPETGSVATLAGAGDHWFMTVGYRAGGNVFDADTGQMQGKVILSDFTSAVAVDRARERVYVPATYYSRGSYGERTDLLVINDLRTLAPIAEVPVPEKLAVVFHRAVVNLVGDRFAVLYNMTPAMSVSVVDVEEQRFVGELSTPGCGFVYPLPDRRFMQLCGDGTVQVIGLDESGAEASRDRSRRFFDVEEDPVFDLAVPASDGWLLISFEGRVFRVTLDGSRIRITESFSLVGEEDAAEGWRVGGDQPFAHNPQTGLLFVLMHQGGPDTHEEPGTEVWAFSTETGRRGYRIALAEPAGAVDVSQDGEPLLYVLAGIPSSVGVYEAATGRLLRTILETGLTVTRVQVF